MEEIGFVVRRENVDGRWLFYPENDLAVKFLDQIGEKAFSDSEIKFFKEMNFKVKILGGE